MNFSGTKRWACIAPEKVEPTEDYTFSINPDKQFDNAKGRLKLVQNEVCKILSLLGDSKTYSFELYPELSRGGRLHWHGTIRITNVLAFFTNIIRIRDFCTYELDTIEDPDKWDEYSKKGKGYMKDAGLYMPLNQSKRRDQMMINAGLRPRRGAIDDYLAEYNA